MPSGSCSQYENQGFPAPGKNVDFLRTHQKKSSGAELLEKVMCHHQQSDLQLTILTQGRVLCHEGVDLGDCSRYLGRESHCSGVSKDMGILIMMFTCRSFFLFFQTPLKHPRNLESSTTRFEKATVCWWRKLESEKGRIKEGKRIQYSNNVINDVTHNDQKSYFSQNNLNYTLFISMMKNASPMPARPRPM